MLRPATLPLYATDANYPAGPEPEAGTPTKVAPTSGELAVGYRPGAKPTAQKFNWWRNLVGEWVDHLDDVRVDEPWMFNAADPAAFADNGWTYTATNADTPTIQNPDADHPRRFAELGNNTGVGESSLRSLFFGWDPGTAVYGMRGQVSIDGFGTAVAYTIEWGYHVNSAASHRIVLKKKNGSANWWLHVQDATGTSEVDTSVPCVAGQVYELELRVITGSVYALIDGEVAATLEGSANFPFNDQIRYLLTSQSSGGPPNGLGAMQIGPIRGWFHPGA